MSRIDMVTAVRLTPTLQEAASLRCTPSDTAWPDALPGIYERQGVTRMATWEGSVLPALREAAAAYPSLRGAEIGCFTGDTDECDRDDPWIRVGSVRVSDYVDRSTFAQMQADVAALAADAAARVASAPKPEPCPVCAVQIVPGVRCRACRAVAEAEEAKPAVDAHAQEVDPATGRTPLPEGWRWYGAYRCGVYCDGEGGRHGVLMGTSGDNAGRIWSLNRREVPAPLHNALVREARRLGLVCREVERPEPNAKQWGRCGECRGALAGEEGEVCSRCKTKRGDRVVLPPGYEFSEVHVATSGVARYEFSEVHVATSGVARITVKTRLVSWHFFSDTLDSPQNAVWALAHPEAFSCVRWMLREAQDAARVHDEPESWTPKVGDRVRLPDLERAKHQNGFVDSMRGLCGLDGVVACVTPTRASVSVDGGYAWWWTMDSLRPA